MAEKSSLYRTIPSGFRSSTRSGSDISVASSTSTLKQQQQQPRKASHAILHDGAARDTQTLNSQPIQISLNLVMNVQKMNGDEYTMKPIELCLNNVDILPKTTNVQHQQQQKSSQNLRAAEQPRRDRRPSIVQGYQSDFEDSVFLRENTSAAIEVVRAKNTETENYVKSGENQIQQQQKQHVAVNDEAKSSGSRSSQDSRKDRKKKNTPSRHYKNKRSLLKFSSLNKPRRRKSTRTSVRFCDEQKKPLSFNVQSPNTQTSQSSTSNENNAPANRTGNKESLFGRRRSKSVGTALPGFKPYPRPRRLSFNGSVYDDEDLAKLSDSKASLSAVPFNSKPRSKSTGTELPDFVPYPRPRRLSFNDSTVPPRDGSIVATNETMISEAYKTFPLDRTFPNSLGFSGFDLNATRSPKPSISFINCPINAVAVNLDANRSIAITPALNESIDRSSLNSNVSFAFSDCSPKNIACDVEVDQPSIVNGITPIFNHQRQIRIGFIANNVQMAVNVVLNIRSDEEVLYLEPVELLYEGNKMWRRSARQVAKEIEAKRLLANKNNLNLSTTKTCELLLTPALKKSCLKKIQAPARRSSSLSSNASSK